MVEGRFSNIGSLRNVFWFMSIHIDTLWLQCKAAFAMSCLPSRFGLPDGFQISVGILQSLQFWWFVRCIKPDTWISCSQVCPNCKSGAGKVDADWLVAAGWDKSVAVKVMPLCIRGCPGDFVGEDDPERPTFKENHLAFYFNKCPKCEAF